MLAQLRAQFEAEETHRRAEMAAMREQAARRQDELELPGRRQRRQKQATLTAKKEPKALPANCAVAAIAREESDWKGWEKDASAEGSGD